MEVGDGDKRDVRRPMNAFLIFCKRHRSIVREKNPDLDNRSVTRILGDLWANLKDDEKAMYTDLAKQYKDAFMKANPDYKWHNPEKAVVAQKTNMPKPTNMKVLKNDMDLFSEGSIMPGKLADPSNMGGLSLLLIAGEQSDHQHLSSSSLEGQNSDKSQNMQDGVDQASVTPVLPEPPYNIADNMAENTANNANPSNMGGLSLLLFAGEQSDHQNLPSSLEGHSSDKPPIRQDGIDYASVTPVQPEPPDNMTDNASENTADNTTDTSDKTTDNIADQSNCLHTTHNSHNEAIDGSSSLTEYRNDEDNGNTPLLGNSTLIHGSQTSNDSMNHHQTLLTQAIFDVAPSPVEDKQITSRSCEDGSESSSTVDTASTMADEEESAMITCGKLVVNHIIDKLYSSEIATAARNVTKPADGQMTKATTRQVTKPTDGQKTNGADGQLDKPGDGQVSKAGDGQMSLVADGQMSKVADGNVSKSENGQLDRCERVTPRTDNDTTDMKMETKISVKAADEPDGGNDQGSGPDQSGVESGLEPSQDDTNDKPKPTRQRLLSESGSSETRQRLYSESGSTEGEEQDESQPVRKSRRRNRGQRYQELINEGIIQPSKERMAALQHPSAKEEMAEEDFQSIDSYILPETAIRRIRKRTTSESYKDKICTLDEAKRYKTGDFDLEAHIATLPACPIESMGRKRGFVRSRHSSESSHIRKHTHDESHQAPVLNTEKTVCLPPHVRLPSPQRSTTPVVGSRKRKARKHSITHLIPVPTSACKNGQQQQNGTVDTQMQSVSAIHKQSEVILQDSVGDKSDNIDKKCDIGGEMVCQNSDSKGEMNSNLYENKGTDCKESTAVPKIESGCVFEHCDNDKVLNNGGNDYVGAEIGGECNKHGASSDHEVLGQELCHTGNIGADNNKVTLDGENIKMHENMDSDMALTENGFTDKAISGKCSDKSCKSLQEVDSNIPRRGSDVIHQNEAVDDVARKPPLQDSREKIVPSTDKTDLNYNTKLTS